ncbi:Phorbol-ester/DAG-type domain-containing protein [Heracleum sosnowskyi]|uniref:Phorbol-ester/DAG-type domain-containing protein n=1 Tax=Heracleum sosnowskyi TaxID=360622 RepID=A0AAD8J4V5_9APIA|nr:Phorbol-ester/DAG-type domain-containing protein [Heracleum sosnowskyi]
MEDIKVYDPSHPEHELVLRNFKKAFNCDGCKEQGFGPRYRCESSDCDYVLHEKCKFRSETATHDFYPDSTFEFSYQPLGQCDNKNYKDLDLHPCCLELKNKMLINGMKFKLTEKLTSKCIWCKSKILKGTSEGGWSYESKCKQYHFHVYCIKEMMQESWKTGYHKDEISLSLKNSDLRLGRRLNGGSSRSGKYWKIVKVFMTAVVAILLGDPTALLATTLFNLIT